MNPEMEALLQLVEAAEVTGIAWRSLSRFYALPVQMKGLKVLDICAGMSDFALRLRQLGAEAHALDVWYCDLAELRSRHRLNFEGVARSVFQTDPESAEGK